MKLTFEPSEIAALESKLDEWWIKYIEFLFERFPGRLETFRSDIPSLKEIVKDYSVKNPKPSWKSLL